MGKNELEAYREAEIQGSSPVELVLMLSDVLVRDIGRVIAAIGCGDIEDRVHRSSHAFEVLQQLEGLLDMENGGSTAEDLSRIYAHIRAKVMEAQFRLEPAILQKQIEMISQLREGWAASGGDGINGMAEGNSCVSGACGEWLCRPN